MDITVAKTAGFCFGVKRAVEQVEEQLRLGKKVYTYGPIIHNEEVIREFSEKGVCILYPEDEWDSVEKGTIIIRSHGVTREEQEKMQAHGFDVVDATCPFVKKIHKIVEEQSCLGRRIIIIGDEKHPEVIGIKGWAKGEVIIADSAETLEKVNLPVDEKLCIVAQTTFNYKKFQELVEIFEKKRYDIFVLNTICNATQERQSEAARLAAMSEAMIVIGGKQSSNTKKLYEIAKNACGNTYYIQKLDDLDLSQFKSFRCVGITAGASTPNKLIEEVQKDVRSKF